MADRKGPKRFIVVTPTGIIEIPQDPYLSWLTMFYLMPRVECEEPSPAGGAAAWRVTGGFVGFIFGHGIPPLIMTWGGSTPCCRPLSASKDGRGCQRRRVCAVHLDC